jgi:hypothetical protein
MPDAAQPMPPAQQGVPPTLQALAQPHAQAAVNVLRSIMNDKKAVPASRLRAALAILELGDVRAAIPSAEEDQILDSSSAAQQEIRRIIVESEHTDG